MITNIVIIEQPLNNRGDESAHKALIRSLISQIDNCKICVLFVGQNDDSIKQFSIDNDNIEYVNFKSGKWLERAFRRSLKYKIVYSLFYLIPEAKKYLKYIKTADWVIVAPGGINMGGFQTWEHLEKINVSKLAGKKIAYFARSFGPFPEKTQRNQQFKRYSLSLLNYFSFISIRDKKTENMARSLGIGYTSTIDTAFLDSPKAIIPSEITDKIANSEYMVFVPNVLKWHYAYKDIPEENITYFYELIMKEILQYFPLMKIVMLPQTFNENDPLWNDINFFYSLEQKINSPRVIVVSDTYSSDIQQTIISKCKFLIGARYHSVVFSINQNIPFIALSYEHKIMGLLETLMKNNCTVQIQDIFDSKTKINKAVEDVLKLIPTIKKDENAMLNAKKIAMGAMKVFTQKMNTEN